MEIVLRPGSRFRSVVCETEVVVVRAPSAAVELCCGGRPMAPIDAGVAIEGPVSPDHAAGTALGKRYTDAEETIEVLCSKPGAGSLSLGAEALVTKSAKPLPASD